MIPREGLTVAIGKGWVAHEYNRSGWTDSIQNPLLKTFVSPPPKKNRICSNNQKAYKKQQWHADIQRNSREFESSNNLFFLNIMYTFLLSQWDLDTRICIRSMRLSYFPRNLCNLSLWTRKKTDYANSSWKDIEICMCLQISWIWIASPTPFPSDEIDEQVE